MAVIKKIYIFFVQRKTYIKLIYNILISLIIYLIIYIIYHIINITTITKQNNCIHKSTHKHILDSMKLKPLDIIIYV